MADIIFAVDEALDATQCGGDENCQDDGPCMTHQLWASLNAKMIEFLDSINLQDLVDQQKDVPVTMAKAKQVSVLREHRAALEIPTSTLQVINTDGLRTAVPAASESTAASAASAEPSAVAAN